MSNNKGISTAYQKMLENGSANKKINMTQYTEPDVQDALGKNNGDGRNTLGERIEKQNIQSDYTEFDNTMREKVENLKSKVNGNENNIPMNSNINNVNEQNDVIKLKNEISYLKEVIMMIMREQKNIVRKINESK